MNNESFSITFACHNAASYTRLCLESLVRNHAPLERLVVVDNGSTDDTVCLLQSYPLGQLILNRQNLGCGVAWNQGALAFQSEWSIIMNNDVLVPAGFFQALIHAASRHGLLIASPALIEGDHDYVFEDFAATSAPIMQQALRPGFPHAVCMAVHQSVWQEIGYFSPTPSLWGYEDTLFFHHARQKDLPMGTVGAAWLHHFGSITQNEIRRERGLSSRQGLGSRTHYRLLHQSWLLRKLEKFRRKRLLAHYRAQELSRYQMTLHGIRTHQSFEWL